jgi:hypothetical protein
MTGIDQGKCERQPIIVSNSQYGNGAPAGLPNPALKPTDLAIRLERSGSN